MDARRLRDRVEHGRKLGARAVELGYVHETGHALAAQRGRIVVVDVAPTERLTVRVWLDGGRAAERSGAPDAVDALLDAAINASARMPEDPHAGPVARQSGVLGGLGVMDRRYDTITTEDRSEVLATAERAVRAVDRRLSPSGFAYRDRVRVRRFASSRGVYLEETDSTYEAVGTVSVGAGSEDLVLSDRIESRTFASIVSLPYGTTLGRRAVDLLQPTVDLAGPIRVLLPPLPLAHLFGAIADRFDARSFGDGAETPLFLQPRADGAPVVDPRLHLQDDGTLPGGLRSSSFDDRGVCPIPLTLLREGRVDGRFLDPGYAHRHDVRPTGHAVAGRLRPTNLVLRSGTRSMNATLSDLGAEVLIVDDLPLTSAADDGGWARWSIDGLDLATGALCARVNGVVVHGNKPVGSVRGLTLRGELLKVLNQIVEVCSDTDRIGHVDAPGIIFDGFVADAG